MSKILIFRTDRIGDLLTTCPAIISLKNSIKNSSITVVTSNKNDSYAKTFSFIDETILFPDNIFDKIKFILKLSKLNFDFIFIFDGKDRSIISSIFLNLSSPFVLKKSLIEILKKSSNSLSLSKNGIPSLELIRLPIVVFPVAINPTKKSLIAFNSLFKYISFKRYLFYAKL